MKKIERVYAYQYGAYYSFSVENWIQLCKEAIKNSKFNLESSGKLIKNKPLSVKIDIDDNPYSVSGFVETVKPLDWNKIDFELSIEKCS